MSFTCPEPKCELPKFGRAGACMCCSELYPLWKKAEADIAMLAWESTLPDEFTPARCGHQLPGGMFIVDVLDNRLLEDLIAGGEV